MITTALPAVAFGRVFYLFILCSDRNTIALVIFIYFTFVGFRTTLMRTPSRLPEICRVSKLVHMHKWFFIKLDWIDEGYSTIRHFFCRVTALPFLPSYLQPLFCAEL